MKTITWNNGVVYTIDQTALPNREIWLKLRTCSEVALALKQMKMRGAPLIGVAAAFGMALTAYNSKSRNQKEFMIELEKSVRLLEDTRPTAINLFWATKRIMRKIKEMDGELESLRHAVINEAQNMAEEDVMTNLRIGKHGAKLIQNGETILTHCNAGSLATVEYGTALAVVRLAWEEGKHIRVFADETRPRLQGARITVYELLRDGIPVTLITDNMAGYFMSKGEIDKVIVGADRIVLDGVANKIGTYTLSVLAKENSIPFYVAAPLSTFDFTRFSKDIIIENRNPDEVTNIGLERITPLGVKVMNPAFDITPLRYITGIICENGVFSIKEFQKLARTSLQNIDS